MLKLAYAIEMAFEIPDSEKEIGKSISERFEIVKDQITQAEKHLDLMYEPFKSHEVISPKSLTENRGVINRYKQQIKKNFNKVLLAAGRALEKLNYFCNDTKVSELITTFRDAVGGIEGQVNDLLDVLNNLESADFRQSVLSSIEKVKKECEQTSVLVQDRIIEYVDTNILTKNWTSNDDLNVNLKNKEPLIVELYKERQETLNGSPALNISKREQAMNPSYTQRVSYPNDLREVPENND